MTTTTTEARLYVGTYEKYNNGSIFGKWVDLDKFSDAKEFLNYCKELHHDEEDPEFMFQDFEGFPDCFYSESASEKDLQKIFDYLSIDEYDKKILEMYLDATGYSFDEKSLTNAMDAYQGQAYSEAEFAEWTAEECGDIPADLPSWIRIDWEASWNCNLRHDYSTAKDSDGTIYFFLNH